MLQEFFTYLEGEWKVIGQAPFTFIIALVILSGVIWLVAKGAASVQLANLKSALDLSDRQIADYKDKLSGKTPDEVAAKIVALEAHIALMQPVPFTGEQGEAMYRILKAYKGTIRINRDIDAGNMEGNYRRFLGVFQNSGWATQDGVVYGDKQKPPGGVALILRANMDDMAVRTIRSALISGGIKFVEYDRPEEKANAPVPQILLSSPYEPARWN